MGRDQLKCSSSSTMSTVTENEILKLTWYADGKRCETMYRVFGDLVARQRTPLVALHGGPGANGDYFLGTLPKLTSSLSIPVVVYDQVGIKGLPDEKVIDNSFWTEELFLTELDTLLEHLGINDDYILFGHSWGGMLSARHATRQPKGLKKVVLIDSPASMPLWAKALQELRSCLPQDIQETLAKHEAAGTTDDPEYGSAMTVFLSKHLCRTEPFPNPALLTGLASLSENSIIPRTMLGDSEFDVTGTLKAWSMIDDARFIKVPTLLINGRYDEAKDSTVQPYFDGIERVKWATLSNSSHMPHLEEPDKFLKVLGEFLTNDDPREVYKERLLDT